MSRGRKPNAGSTSATTSSASDSTPSVAGHLAWNHLPAGPDDVDPETVAEAAKSGRSLRVVVHIDGTEWADITTTQ